MTIIEAIQTVLTEEERPLTPQEIYKGILRRSLYTFHAERPEHVVNSQIRRHCINFDFPSASEKKHFKLYGDNLFYLLADSEKRKKKTIRNTKSVSPSSTLKELHKLHDLYTARFRAFVLSKLKNLSPVTFEVFSKRLMDEYGFTDMKVTQVSKDGGIDGHGKLKVGLTYLNVAFQAKRWTKGKVGRPEIDRFRGAIQGQYEQGIFFTTSTFAPGAAECSFRPGAVPIILIDGNAIVDMMIEKGFGIQKNFLPAYEYALDLVLNEESF